MKICNSCKQQLSETNFNFKNKTKNILQNFCRECKRKQQRKWYERHVIDQRVRVKNRKKKVYQELLAIVYELKKQPCKDCKQHFKPWQMDFDHLKDKKFNISQSGRCGYSIEKILEEIQKCEIVCSNCHRDRTYKRRMGHSEVESEKTV